MRGQPGGYHGDHSLASKKNIDIDIENIIPYLMVEHEGISKSPLSPARLAANRRHARKSTGPKTKAGKRRAALNGRRLDVAFPAIERRLFALGATKATRTYPRPTKVDGLLDKFQSTVGDILAGAGQNAADQSRTEARAGEGLERQNKANSKP